MMDQAKIGKFISDMRKKQGLTRKQLSDQLNVTDKTVSKWETGEGKLMKFCDATTSLTGALHRLKTGFGWLLQQDWPREKMR